MKSMGSGWENLKIQLALKGLISTWYRPAHSPSAVLDSFASLIDKIDAENIELVLLGDLNFNLLNNANEIPQITTNCNSTAFLDIFDIYTPVNLGAHKDY